MQTTIRKNFAFDPTVVAHLEEIAAEKKASLTKTLQELIEKRYEETLKQKKLKAARSIAGSSSGTFGELSIQEIKANMYV